MHTNHERTDSHPTATSPRQGDPLADFRANPHLVMHKAMTDNRAAVLGSDATVEQQVAVAAELDDCAPVGPTPGHAGGQRVRLSGSLTVTRNRTSQATHRTLTSRPTRAQHVASLVAEHLVHDLLATGMPATLAAQADTIAALRDPIVAQYATRGLDRRGPIAAEAAARYLLTWAQPAGLTFAHRGTLRRWHRDPDDTPDHTDTPADARLEPTALAADLFTRPRICWVSPDGPAAGLLLDRFHHTPYEGVIERDTWIRGKIAADLRRAAAFLQPRPAGASAPHTAASAVLGVRVLTHLAPNAGVHFVAAFPHGPGTPPVVGGHHRIGGCIHCTTRVVLPNQTPVDATGARS